MTPVPVWRPMRREDLPAVSRLAKEVHPAYPEDDAVAAERLALAPRWCRVLDEGGALAGYIIAHPGRVGDPPHLDALLGALPDRADCLHVHDVVVAPHLRGRGFAEAGVRELLGQARGEFVRAALISIAGRDAYWSRLGFLIRERPDLAPVLSSYDAGARYMIAELTP